MRGFHQPAPDALSLAVWCHGHGSERRADDVADDDRAVYDVTHDAIVDCGDQREHHAAVGSERVHDAAFHVLAERAPIDFADGRSVPRLLLADLDHREVVKAWACPALA